MGDEIKMVDRVAAGHRALTDAIAQRGIESREAAEADKELWALTSEISHSPGCKGGTGQRNWGKDCTCSYAPAVFAHFGYKSDRSAAASAAKYGDGAAWLASGEGNYYEQIARAMTPPVVKRIEFRGSLSGRACTHSDLIKVPRPKTAKSLYMYAHECGHMALHHHSIPGIKSKTRHREEYEAERWAHKAMRDAGVTVPRSMTDRAKEYVRYKIEQAVSAGAKAIDRDAAKWSGWAAAKA